MDPIDYLKLLLDPDRLKVIGRVALEPAPATEIAEATGLPTRVVLEGLAPLVDAGIVSREDGRYRLVPEALREVARAVPGPEPPAEAVFWGMTQEEGEVLARFFHGRRLTEIPSNRAKRLVVLERVALVFEPGVRYSESEVNALLAEVHEDHAALRRWLVDEGFLDRDAGTYWRAGGRIEA